MFKRWGIVSGYTRILEYDINIPKFILRGKNAKLGTN